MKDCKDPDEVACALDMTRERTGDAAIRQHLQLLSDIVERSPVVAVTWRNAPGWPLSYASANIVKFGYRPDDSASGQVRYVDIVHPEDHARIASPVTSVPRPWAGIKLCSDRSRCHSLSADGVA